MPEENHTIEYVIGTLVGVLVILIIALVLNYRALRRSVVVNARQSFLSALMADRHGPVTVADLAYIRPWMTFDYINRFFNVPPQYLQSQLLISDKRYPRLTISSYVKTDHLDLAAFMHQLDAVLRARLMSTGSTTL